MLRQVTYNGDPIPAPSATPEAAPEFPSLVRDELDNQWAKTKVDKKEAFKHFLSLFPEKGLDLDPEQAREDRLGF